jgi:hypothetical protein
VWELSVELFEQLGESAGRGLNRPDPRG